MRSCSCSFSFWPLCLFFLFVCLFVYLFVCLLVYSFVCFVGWLICLFLSHLSDSLPAKIFRQKFLGDEPFSNHRQERPVESIRIGWKGTVLTARSDFATRVQDRLWMTRSISHHELKPWYLRGIASSRVSQVVRNGFRPSVVSFEFFWGL